MIPPFIDDVEKLVNKNRIWLDRSVGIAAITGEEAINWGWTGPCLRASGVAYDVRRATPTTSTTRSTGRCRCSTAATSTTASASA